MTPSVSVIMPARNAARWLEQAIASLQAQTLADFELLVIDDCSTDDTHSILLRIARLDPRIRIFRTSARGLVHALNLGIAQAHGDLLARLDADDKALPERLAIQVRYLSDNPEVGLLGSWAHRINDRGAITGRLRPATEPDELQRILPKANPFIHSSIVLRTTLARRLQGYRAMFEGAEDYDLWLRLAELTVVANVPEYLVQYRRHSLNTEKQHALRQSFSHRLAQRSAELRRRGVRDPAADFEVPPHWRSEGAAASFFANIAEIYRLLEFSDPRLVRGAEDISPLLEQFGQLNHAERKLASLAIRNFYNGLDEPRLARLAGLLSALFSLPPKHALKIGWYSLRS
jgi:glycosyltransferase involved in cell wall biosynthesis